MREWALTATFLGGTMFAATFLRDLARIPWGTAPLVALLHERMAALADEYIGEHLVDQATGMVAPDALASRSMGRSEAPVWRLILEHGAHGGGPYAIAAGQLLRELLSQNTTTRTNHFEDLKIVALRTLLGLPPNASPEAVIQLAAEAFPTRNATLIRQAVFEGDSRPVAPLRLGGAAPSFRQLDPTDRGLVTLLTLAATRAAQPKAWRRFEQSFLTWVGEHRGSRSIRLYVWRDSRYLTTMPAIVLRLAIGVGILPFEAAIGHPATEQIWLPVTASRLAGLAGSPERDAPSRQLLLRGVLWRALVNDLRPSPLPIESPVLGDESSARASGHAYFIDDAPCGPRLKRRIYSMVASTAELVRHYVPASSSQVAAGPHGLRQRSLSGPDYEALAWAIVQPLAEGEPTHLTGAGFASACAAITDLARQSAHSSIGRGQLGPSTQEDSQAAVTARLVRAFSTLASLVASDTTSHEAAREALRALRDLVGATYLAACRQRVTKRESAQARRVRLSLLREWQALAARAAESPAFFAELGGDLNWPLPLTAAELPLPAGPIPMNTLAALSAFGETAVRAAQKALAAGHVTLETVVTTFPRAVALGVVQNKALRRELVALLAQRQDLHKLFLEQLHTALQDRPKVAACLELALLSDITILPNLLRFAEDLHSASHHTYGSQLSGHYETYLRPKRSGGKRLVAVPSVPLMFTQRRLLATVFDRAELHDAAHGFVKGRNTVSNALPHVGKQLVVNVDIRNFFGSTRYPLIRNACRAALNYSATPRAVALLAELCSFHGSLPTGAPTSPAIANLILRSFDASVTNATRQRGVAYTRYADDLTFSGSGHEPVHIIPFVERLLAEMDYELDSRKTNLFRKGRRQEVTGLVVNHRPSVSRTYRRKLRSAIHTFVTTGLATWHGRPTTLATLLGHLGHLAQTQPEEARRLRKRLDMARG